MLGALSERLAYVCATGRRGLLVFAFGLLALVALTIVRLPRPADFLASLGREDPVQGAREAALVAPVLRLRVEHVDRTRAAAVVAAVSAALPQAMIYVAVDALAGDAVGSATSAADAAAVLDQLPPLMPLLSLDETARLPQLLTALAGLPDGKGLPTLDVLVATVAEGKAADPDALVRTLGGLLHAPEATRVPGGDLRWSGDDLDIWLRALPHTGPEELRSSAEPFLAAVHSLGLRATLEGYALHLASRTAPRWHVLACTSPALVAALLAFALGASLRLAALAALGSVAALAFPLLALLIFVPRLDPAAVWALCGVGGAYASLVPIFLGLHLGRQDAAVPLLRRLRWTLRDTVLPAGLITLVASLGAARGSPPFALMTAATR